MHADDDGTRREAEINVTDLAGFLLAKVAAAYGRRKPKVWSDIAFVLLHNDLGDVSTAADRVLDVFGPPAGTLRTQLDDLQANFGAPNAQGTLAYVNQLTLDHREADPAETAETAADAQLAVSAFVDALLAEAPQP